MISKDMKEDLKRMRRLRDGGKKDVENSRDSSLGFVDDKEDYGAVLIDGECLMGRNR